MWRGSLAIFLLLVVFFSSLAVFGVWGIVLIFPIIVAVAVALARRSWGFLALAGCLLSLLFFLLHLVECRERAWRMACGCPTKQIAVALHNYHEQYGAFPPAYIADKDGKPMHSWRVLILPFLDMDSYDFYRRYRFDEPWDGPNNKKLLTERPSVYRCLSDPNANRPGSTSTSYGAVVGTDAAWPGATSRVFADCRNSILIVEASEANIPWTEPRDLSLDALLAASPSRVTISSGHDVDKGFFTDTNRSGSTVVFADGSVKFLPRDLIGRKGFLSALKVGGATEETLEAIPRTAFTDEPHIRWPNCIAFAVWTASTLALLVVSFRFRFRPKDPHRGIQVNGCELTPPKPTKTSTDEPKEDKSAESR